MFYFKEGYRRFLCDLSEKSKLLAIKHICSLLLFSVDLMKCCDYVRGKAQNCFKITLSLVYNNIKETHDCCNFLYIS